MKRAMLCAALGASAFIVGTTAQAEEGLMRVRLADLNLATPAGAHVALARIRWNAGVFCEAAPGPKSLARAAVIDRCVTDMTRKGVTQLNAPLVTALFEGEASGRPSTPVAVAQR